MPRAPSMPPASRCGYGDLAPCCYSPELTGLGDEAAVPERQVPQVRFVAWEGTGDSVSSGRGGAEPL